LKLNSASVNSKSFFNAIIHINKIAVDNNATLIFGMVRKNANIIIPKFVLPKSGQTIVFWITIIKFDKERYTDNLLY